MLLTLFMLFWVQEDHQHKEKISFQPIAAGNQLSYPNFTLDIPQGTFYADEENVPYMFRLAGAEHIPNCIGMYYSASADWQYAVAVQLIDEARVVFEPRLTPEQLGTALSGFHLHSTEAITERPEIIIPATFDDAEQSFTFGVSFSSGDLPGVFIKKVFISEDQAIVLSLKANQAGFQTNKDTIMEILGSVTPLKPIGLSENSGKTVTSFLELLGLQLTNPNPSEGASEEIEPIFPLPALLGGLAGLLLLAGALLLRSRQPKVSE